MIFLVSVVSALGAVMRYLVDTAVSRRVRGAFPAGTFAINMVGAFSFGAVTALAGDGRITSTTAALLGPGFCAGFTTFSTWMWETVALWIDGQRLQAAMNLGLTVVAGAAAAAAGLSLVS